MIAILYVAGLLATHVMSSETQRQEVNWNIPDRPEIAGVTHFVIHSPSMDRDIGYNVFLPASYAASERRYPVIYFLHGAGGTENSDAGGFSSLVKAQMDAKAIPDAICVFPNGGMSGYVDRLETKIMGESLIIKELIPKIDSQFRTIANREGRAICGFSMGGGGAIRLATKYPDMFGSAASWAAALRARGAENDAAAIVKQNADKIKGRLGLLLIVGDKDLTFDSHAPVIEAFKASNISYDYRVLPGVDHNLGVYYSDTGKDFVQFLAKNFPK